MLLGGTIPYAYLCMYHMDTLRYSDRKGFYLVPQYVHNNL